MVLNLRSPLRGVQTLLFGRVQFTENEEYLEFRYKFLILLMIAGAILTLLVILGTLSEINPVGWRHGWSMIFFTTTAFLMWWLLR